MQRSSPRASAGFSRFAASTAPSAAPAPTSVCSSSMNSTIRPSESSISLSTAFRRSSNSPRYFEPAIKRAEIERDDRAVPAASRARRRRRCAAPAPRRSPSCRRRGRRSAPGCSWCAGTAPASCAGSPRRGRSPGRACRGARARSGRARSASSAWNLSSGFGSVTRLAPRTSRSAARMPCRAWRRSVRSISDASSVPRAIASSRCSVETYSSWNSRAIASARLEQREQRRVTWPGRRGHPRAGAPCSRSLRRRGDRPAGRRRAAASIGRDHALFLAGQGHEQVQRADLRVPEAIGRNCRLPAGLPGP